MGTKKIAALLVGIATLIGLGIYGYNNNAYGPLVDSYHKAVADETGELNALADQIRVSNISYDECLREDLILSECDALGELIDEASQIEAIPPLPDGSSREQYKQRRGEVRDNAKLARETRESLIDAIEELESAEPEPTPSEDPTDEESPEEEPEQTEEPERPRETDTRRERLPEPRQNEPPARPAPDQPRDPAPEQPRRPAPSRPDPAPEPPRRSTPAPAPARPQPRPTPVPMPMPEPIPAPQPAPEPVPVDPPVEEVPEPGSGDEG